MAAAQRLPPFLMSSTADDRHASLRLLRAKAMGIVSAIERMTHGERDQYPTGLFAENYNQIVRSLKSLVPDRAEILPPEIPVEDWDTGRFSPVRIYEVWAFCGQLTEMIAVLLQDVVNDRERQ